MKLSTRSTYGMRALVELALSGGRGPLSASMIAKRQALSVAYLEQLLHRLKKRGLVRSVRGPRGGYVLARGPQEITMAQVVHVLDGDEAAVRNGRGPNGRRRALGNDKTVRGRSQVATGSQQRAQRIAHAVWRCVHERLAQSLDAVTLRDLCDEVRTDAGEPEHRYVFHI